MSEFNRGFAPDLAAKAAAERRFVNSRANAAEIARHNELLAELERNNADLIAFGEPPVEIEPADPVELHWRMLRVRIATLGRLIRHQNDRLEELSAAAAAAERERVFETLSPELRLVLRENAELRSRVEQLECGRADVAHRVAPPTGPLHMPFAPVPTGDGLCPGAVRPSATSVSAAGAAHRLGASGRGASEDARPALTHAHPANHDVGCSPGEWQRAIAASRGR